MKLAGKIIIITGASSGIGEALATELVKEAAIVVLVSRSKDKLQKVADELQKTKSASTSIDIFPCDVTDEIQVNQLFDYCMEKYHRVDILINNAGWGVYARMDETSMEDIRKVMEINFFGAVKCMLKAIEVMKPTQGGTIVNVTSVAALHGVPYLGAYGATKAALENLSQSMQAENKDDNIRISLVYPGYTKTSFFENEKLIGKVKRPDKGYKSAEFVAKKIVKAIKKERFSLVIGLDGKLLYYLDRWIPRYVRRVMYQLAMNLRTDS
ncbi:MAG: SDR family oxidoreductase [Bacteroidales bacterium]|nr:SDR family oxidoreductase [Bacteroidales bacterium]